MCNIAQISLRINEIVVQIAFSPFDSAEGEIMWILSKTQDKKIARRSHSQLEALVRERTEELQALTQRLLRVQDEEKRRLARDLHDSAGQTLAGLKMAISLLQAKLNGDARNHEEFQAVSELADQALQEIRTTSYLLHPPLLDEVGFGCAAQLYAEGFARRSGILVRLNFAREENRLPAAMEIALFRVLQESLTNVHRHSGAKSVDVAYMRDAEGVTLEVRDYGSGIPQESLGRLGRVKGDSGVGLAGMRERLSELEGDLEIVSVEPGTRLRASVPLMAAAAVGQEASRQESLHSTPDGRPDCRPVFLQSRKSLQLDADHGAGSE